MLTDTALLEYALQQIARKGCDGADVMAYRNLSVSCSVLSGKLEDSERSLSQGIGVRVFRGQRVAYAATEDTSEQGINTLLDNLVEMVGYVPADPFVRLACSDEICKNIPALDLCDPMGEPDFKVLQDLALQTENAGLQVKGVSKSDGAGAGYSMTSLALATSNGFMGGYTSTDYSLSGSMIAGQGFGMERDYAASDAVYLSDLETAQAIGTRSGTRAVSRLNPRLGKTGAYPVLYDRRVASSLMGHALRAINGNILAKRTSFLNDALGQPVFSPHITITEDPLKPRGLRSRPFDAECLPVVRRDLFANGVLQNLLLDLRSAARLNMQSTGSASRGLSSPPAPSAANVWMHAGTATQTELIQTMGTGLLVTELLGSQISLATGDYSRGASGFWVENGVIAYPVSEMTIAGNLRDMFKTMIAGNDLEFRSGMDAPSLLVDGMTVATRG